MPMYDWSDVRLDLWRGMVWLSKVAAVILMVALVVYAIYWSVRFLIFR
jgi:hypothetical protein